MTNTLQKTWIVIEALVTSPLAWIVLGLVVVAIIGSIRDVQNEIDDMEGRE